jgi:hypothetical protein
VRAVLEEEPLPIKAFRRFEPYHEIPEARERRRAVVALHYEGWAHKSVARYLKIDRSTVRRVLERWELEGPEGLEDRKRSRPKAPPPYVELPLEHLRHVLPVPLVAALPEVTDEAYLLQFLSADVLQVALDGSLLVSELCLNLHRLS